MQKIINLYILCSSLAFIGSIIDRYYTCDNYFAFGLGFYYRKLTNIILYNFSLAIIFFIQKTIVKIVFQQMKQIQKIKIIQKLKIRMLDLLFIIFINPQQFTFEKFFIILLLLFSFVIHNLTIHRSQYLINTHSITLHQHYKLLAFFFLLFFIDYQITKNTLIWIYHHNNQSLIFLYYILYIMFSIIQPLIQFLLHLYERFTLYQIHNLNQKLSIISLCVNLPRLAILIIIGLCIAFKFTYTIWFILSLVELIMDMISLIKGYKNMSILTKTMQLLPKVNRQQIMKKDDDICMVCFRQMQQGRILPCNHIFHSQCLKQWIQKNTNHFCPKCKRAFDFSSDGKSKPVQNMPVQNQRQRQQAAQYNRLNNPFNEQKKEFNNIIYKNGFEMLRQNDEKQEDIQVNVRIQRVGSTAFCLPCEAIYDRNMEDFRYRNKVKDLNGKVNSILEFNPKLQVIVLDE